MICAKWSEMSTKLSYLLYLSLIFDILYSSSAYLLPKRNSSQFWAQITGHQWQAQKPVGEKKKEKINVSLDI